MYQMKRFIDMEQSSPLSVSCFYQLGLCSVSYIANECSTSFSRVIIVQDFETVTSNVLFAYKPTFCYFLLNEKRACFKSVQ